MNRKNMDCMLKGLIRACIVTLLGMIVFSIINFLFPASEGFRSIFILIITLISIMYGAVYASRKSRKNGWIIGIALAFMYMLIFYLISVVAGRETALAANDYIRIALALLVGTLSGMLGINM
ncbi:TIGR04086 family membrane protein [Clostridium sp. KNHs214]|uniref:TIGR04086 family membrane protein n=1 Tax=Clostridium sp. KNHs214 TaxID=1540257 RepID=UPI00068E9142|nr:TIGR04086 family membrane protein [Clostridium sp. KNHs214]